MKQYSPSDTKHCIYVLQYGSLQLGLCATSAVCSNRPHQCTACRRCGL